MNRRSFIAASGSLLLAPSTSAQQPGRVYRIGFMVQAAGSFLQDALSTALRELGWVAGRNLQLETRLSAGPADIGEIAKELVAARCDLIVVAGTADPARGSRQGDRPRDSAGHADPRRPGDTVNRKERKT